MTSRRGPRQQLQSRWHAIAAEIAVQVLAPRHRPRFREEWGAALDEISEAGLPVGRAALRIIISAPSVAFALRHKRSAAVHLTSVDYLRSNNAVAQLYRYLMVTCSTFFPFILSYAAGLRIGPLMGLVAGLTVSTVIANEWHRQLTFRATDRVSWFTAQCQGSCLTLVSLGIIAASLNGLETWAPPLVRNAEEATDLAIISVVGLIRFLALRRAWGLPNRAEAS